MGNFFPVLPRKSRAPEIIALSFYEAQRLSQYSKAWNLMSPAYQSFWKSFEQYVDFMTRSRTMISEFNTLRLENQPADIKQDGAEHIMLWFQTANKDYFFFNLIRMNSVWKVYSTGGVAHPGDFPK